MSGIALSAPSLVAALQGCAADQAPGWAPAFLTDEELALVADLAETILPVTSSSPGARDVLVHRYIDMMLADYSEAATQSEFRESLNAFDQAVRAEHGSPFTELDADTQLSILTQINADALSAQPTAAGSGEGMFPFFLNFKQAVFVGYFTSEQVGEQVLAYSSVPGDYVGCLPLEEATGGKAWSL